MKDNVGKTDKIIRLALGAAVIGFAIMNQSWWGLIGPGIMFPAIRLRPFIYSNRC